MRKKHAIIVALLLLVCLVLLGAWVLRPHPKRAPGRFSLGGMPLVIDEIEGQQHSDIRQFYINNESNKRRFGFYRGQHYENHLYTNMFSNTQHIYILAGRFLYSMDFTTMKKQLYHIEIDRAFLMPPPRWSGNIPEPIFLAEDSSQPSYGYRVDNRGEQIDKGAEFDLNELKYVGTICYLRDKIIFEDQRRLWLPEEPPPWENVLEKAYREFPEAEE